MEKEKHKNPNEDVEQSTMVRFFRKGQVGDWKNHFSSTEADKVKEWVKTNVAGTGLDFGL